MEVQVGSRGFCEVPGGSVSWEEVQGGSGRLKRV